MPKKSSATASPSLDLQKINEEIYKRNAELAIKNRSLSLLYSLYDAATHSIDVAGRAVQITKTVQHFLELPFFGLALVPTGLEVCLPLSAMSVRLGKTHVYLVPPGADFDEEGAEHHPSAASRALLSVRRRHLASEHFVEKMFGISFRSWPAWVNQPEPFFYAFPLRINNDAVGFMILGLDKQFDDIDKFERKIIENVRNVVAISIDNARNYHALLSANTRLKELDRQKTEFLSIASHQLRTPLSIIKGYLELIGDGAYGAPSAELKKILGHMDQSNERLIGLVDEFLDVSRIEQGRTKFAFAPDDISALITDVTQELDARAKDRGLSIRWQVPSHLPAAVMDKEKVRHVVFNFIDNAIKYSPTGEIAVSAVRDGSGISVRVADHGIGFDKDDEVNFFQKFYRGKNVEGVNVNGTGLGIYVCRQFIENHHGKVWAKSPGKGLGSEFGFWIPLVQPVAAQVSPPAASGSR